MVSKIERGPNDKGKFVTQDVSATISINDKSRGLWKDFKLTNLETENTKFGKVDMANATVVPTSTDYYNPRFKDEVKIRINGERVYTGYVGEVKDKKDATFEVKCFNDIRKLQHTSVNINTEEDFVKAGNLLENVVLKEAGVTDYNVQFDKNKLIKLKGDGKTKRESSANTNVKFSQAGKSAMDIIGRIARFTNSIWYVDGSGTLQFGDPETDVYKLSYVIDASAGKTTPPYQSVEVIGGAAASQSSWEDSEDIQKKPIRETRALVNLKNREKSQNIKVSEDELTSSGKDVFRVIEGETREPVYRYKDKAIQTGRHAKAISNALVDELIRQTRQGWVEIVGWAPLNVFDVIEMPSFMGGEQYLVQGVEHTLDTSKGFKTKIQCGGLIASGNESDEVGGYE